ncbi:MAG: ABC transporter substrate-binding protein [Actinomycetota bacterium]
MSITRRRSMATGLVPAVAGLAALTLGLSACTTGATGSGGEGTTDTIRSTMIADPNSFYPYTASGVPGTQSSSLLYASLVALDSDAEDGVSGDLATDWDVTPTKGTFTLREDATCADGTTITPNIVKDSLDEFAKTSKQKSQVFGPNSPKITADDDAGTVTIELDKPWADMLRGLSQPEAGIVCPAGLEDPEKTATGEVEAAFSGPYTLEDFKPGASVEFTLRDSGYTFPEFAEPLKGDPAKTVHFTVSTDYNSVANSMITGDLDVATITGEPMVRFKDEEDFSAERFSVGTMFLVFNERDGRVFADADKRRAVAQAIDRSAYAKAATNGLGEPSTSFVSETVPCANTDESRLIANDPAAAAESLEGAESVQLGTPAVAKGAGNKYVDQVVSEAGAKNTLRSVDPAGLATELASKPESWDMAILNFISTSGTLYDGISRFTGMVTEDGGRNSTGDEHKDVQKLLAQAMAEEDESKRCENYAKLQDRVFDQAYAVPLSGIPAQLTTAPGFEQRIYDGLPATKTMRITK